MIKDIISQENKIFKQTKKLNSKHYRRKEGLFIVEGQRIVNDAIKNGNVKYIIIDENYSNEQFEFPIYRFSSSLFKQICDTQTPQGIVAVCEIPTTSIDHINGDMLVICDGVSDPGNLGAIIRTAECSGADGVILLADCVDAFSPKVVRSTMGSIFRLPIYFCDISDLKNLQDYDIIATMLDGTYDLFETSFDKKVAVVIGNEARGVSDEVANIATKRVKIPMYGGAESLNAAIAGAIVMYDVLRKRK